VLATDRSIRQQGSEYAPEVEKRLDPGLKRSEGGNIKGSGQGKEPMVSKGGDRGEMEGVLADIKKEVKKHSVLMLGKKDLPCTRQGVRGLLRLTISAEAVISLPAKNKNRKDEQPDIAENWES